MGLCNRDEKEIYTKEGEGVSIVERRVERYIWVHPRIVEERIYQTLEVILNSTGVFCRKEKWKKTHSTEL